MELQSGSLAAVGHCGSTAQRKLRSKALPLEVELASGASLTGSTLRSVGTLHQLPGSRGFPLALL